MQAECECQCGSQGISPPGPLLLVCLIFVGRVLAIIYFKTNITGEAESLKQGYIKNYAQNLRIIMKRVCQSTAEWLRVMH